MGKSWHEKVKSGEAELTNHFLAGAGSGPLISSLRRRFLEHGRKLTYSKSQPGVTSGLTPPHQPMSILVEGNNINYEDFTRDWIMTFTGTGGFRMEGHKLYEKFYYSEASQLHGNMLQKQTYQRNQAKELLASIQSLKTAIINIESDLEKLNEQLEAFKDGDWQQIKGLFIDNYGGPQRSWNAMARNVPMVRMAMTWFLRIDVSHDDPEKMPIAKFAKLKITQSTKPEKAGEISSEMEGLKKKLQEGADKNKKADKERIDELVEEEQLNPAVANYLKRKFEEFWNWVVNYVEWITRTRNNVYDNLIQQKANLKLYMRWAADHIQKAQRMEMNPEDITGDFPEFNLRGSPKQILAADYMFYVSESNRADIYELCKPWIPVILSSIVSATTVELQQKFTEVGFINYHGFFEKKDLNRILELSRGGGKDLLEVMKEAGAVTEEELPKIFTPEEIKEMKGEAEETEYTFKEELDKLVAKVGDNLDGFAGLFGLGLDRRSLPWTRKRRAASMAADLAFRGIRNYKKSKGMLVVE